MSLKSMNIAEDRKRKLKELFPEVFDEEQLNFEKLKRIIEDGWGSSSEEKYEMTWPGKSECLNVIQEPSIGTLKPCKRESINFDSTQNLFIEGDNLEVLKLLQKAYYGKIKMIYIDPPYNTGKEFVYPDKYSESLDTYLKYTGQKNKEGVKFSTNQETNGRFHSRWLSMMYSRLFLARNLLKDDGVIFISIDDSEVNNLRKICDEVFGEENFLALFPRITKKAGKTTDLIAKNHDYIVCFRKYSDTSLNKNKVLDENYKNSDEFEESRGKYKLSQPLDYNSIRYSPSLDYEVNLDDEIFIPGNVSKKEILERKKRNPDRDFCWRWSRKLFNFGLENGFIVVKKTSKGKRLYTKTYMKATIEKDNRGDYYIRYADRAKAISTLDLVENKFSNDNSRKDIAKVFSAKLFEYSKPLSLLKEIISKATNDDDAILDFFAGSATTAHAVMDLNKEDGGNRKYIMVQLPEPCDKNSEAFKVGLKTIADIGKERIRKVAEKIEEELSKKNKQLQLMDKNNGKRIESLDIGFKVFKLDKSNFRVWDNKIDGDVAMQLELHLDKMISSNSSDEDILYEILLKSGFELTEQIKSKTLVNKTVYSIKDNELLICLDKKLSKEVILEMAKLEPFHCICLDIGFEDNDQLKANAVETMRSHGVINFKTI